MSRTAPPPVITGSVGRWEKKGARANLQADVETVQRLLETAAQKLQAPDLDPKGCLMERLRGSLRNRIPSLRSKLFQKRSNISIDGLIETRRADVAGTPAKAAGGTYPLPNGDPQTYIKEISVSLDDS